MTKETKYNYNMYKIVCIILGILLVISIGVSTTYINKGYNTENIVIPKNMNGLIYQTDGESIILKLNTNNLRHLDLLERITVFCKATNLQECEELIF